MPTLTLPALWRVVSMPSLTLPALWRVVSVPSLTLPALWTVVSMPSLCSGLMLCTQEALARSLPSDARGFPRRRFRQPPPRLVFASCTLDVRRSSVRLSPEPAMV